MRPVNSPGAAAAAAAGSSSSAFSASRSPPPSASRATSTHPFPSSPIHPALAASVCASSDSAHARSTAPTAAASSGSHPSSRSSSAAASRNENGVGSSCSRSRSVWSRPSPCVATGSSASRASALARRSSDTSAVWTPPPFRFAAASAASVATASDGSSGAAAASLTAARPRRRTGRRRSTPPRARTLAAPSTPARRAAPARSARAGATSVTDLTTPTLGAGVARRSATKAALTTASRRVSDPGAPSGLRLALGGWHAAAAATYWSRHSYSVQTDLSVCAAVRASSRNWAASAICSGESVFCPILRFTLRLLARSNAASIARSCAPFTTSAEMALYSLLCRPLAATSQSVSSSVSARRRYSGSASAEARPQCVSGAGNHSAACSSVMERRATTCAGRTARRSATTTRMTVGPCGTLSVSAPSTICIRAAISLAE